MRIRCVQSPYRMTQKYGYDPNYPINDGFHKGTDYVPDDGIIVAPMDSYITATGRDPVNGNYMVLESGGFRDWFSHIKDNGYLVTGGEVKNGQPIAVMGNTGFSKGVHVHHGLRVNGVLVDPEEYITKGEDMWTEKEVRYLFSILKLTPTDRQIQLYTDSSRDKIELPNNLLRTARNDIVEQSSKVSQAGEKIDNRDKVIAQQQEEIKRLEAELGGSEYTPYSGEELYVKGKD